jgi:Transposase
MGFPQLITMKVLPAMTPLSSTASPTMWVAIDIAKVHNQVLVEFPGGRRRPFRMANALADFSKLGVSLAGSGCTCRIAFEATGDYHRPLAYFLQAHGFSLSLVSSIAVARTRDALYNSWDKNDPKDVQVILDSRSITIPSRITITTCRKWPILTSRFPSGKFASTTAS